ncbi:hypothetical protein [Glaciibacter sp. 2TAF33]|uniref:hypothetical protein n=1 Tax=Glaciibacter sp. 2TAF33 TaxID=3233015 RepID=UPI003F8FC01C
MNPVTTTPGSRREARLSRRRRNGAGRRLAVTVAVLASGILGVAGAIPASAYWQSAGTGAGTIATGTLAAPTNVTVPAASSTTVTVGWTASVGSPAPTGYFITRTSGSTTVAACATSKTALVSGTSCTDAAVPVGTYTYAVTAVYRSWTAASAASGNVTVATASKLVFTSAPTTTAAGTALSVAVAVQSSTGVTVPTAGVPVTVALGANPGNGTLSGVKTATTDASGVATFTGLRLDKVGVGYTLLAAGTGLVGATSPAFAVTAGAAATMAFTTSAVSGSASATASLGPLTVQVLDAFGNATVAPAGGISLSFASTSTGVAVFSPTPQGAAAPVGIAAGASSATFFYGDTKAGPVQITVSSALPAISQAATITAAAASKLLITQQPTTTRQGMVIRSVTAIIVDAFGNPTASTAAVSIAILNNPSLQGRATLSGTTTRTAVDGLVSFDDLFIVGNGNQVVRSGYTLQATSPDLTPATSAAFEITG